MIMNVSLDTASITAINISTLDFRIWQHFNSNCTLPHLQKLANVPEVPVVQIYKHIVDTLNASWFFSGTEHLFSYTQAFIYFSRLHQV